MRNLNFHSIKNNLMRLWSRLTSPESKPLALGAVAVGALGIVVLLLTGLSTSNALMTSALALVVLGVAMYVYLLKKEGKY